MLSKTSFFNQTLYRKTLSRFWPMWGMVTFIALLLPAAMLLELSQHGMEPHDLTYLYYNALGYVLPGVSLVYAILCAVASWDYLFQPRNLSLMHTLPIRREGLFATSFLAGMSMMLIPYVVTGLMCILVSLLFGCFELLALVETIAGVIGLSLFYFSSATFVAFLTGNIFLFPALYFLLHFLAPLLDFLCCIFSNGFIYGLSTDYSGVVNFLSPTVYIMSKIDIERLTEEVVVNNVYPQYTEIATVGYDFHGLWIIGVYALVGLVLLAVAWALYRRRRSECAGDVVAVGWMKPIFRYGIAILAAMTGGLVLYSLLWGIVHSGTLMDALPLAVFMTIAGLIGYYAASMMLAKSLRVFRGSWKGIVAIAAFSAVLCAGLHFDVLGIGARVPAMDDIQEMSFRAANNDYTFVPGEDDALLAEVLELHGTIAADTDYIVDFIDRDNNNIAIPLDESGDWDYSNISPYNSVRFTYKLKNGTTMERYYNLHVTRDRLAQPDTYDAKLDALINSVEMRCKRLMMDEPEYLPMSGDIWFDYGNYDSFSLNDREAAVLLEAIRADATNATWGTYDWFGDIDAITYAINVSIYLERSTVEDGIDHDYGRSLDFEIREGMTNTINALISLGYIETEEDLLTYPEREALNFDTWLKDWYGKSLDELSMAELEKYCEESGYDVALILGELGMDAIDTPAYPETAEVIVGNNLSTAVGIIGGADGPTAVYVTK